MELLFRILEAIDKQPGILVAWAAFHPFALLLLLIPLWILKKLGLHKPKEELGLVGFSITMIIAIGWIMGFASQILLLFMVVSGLKMLFIYTTMYLCIIFYVLFNGISLQKKFLKATKKPS
jgi:hypothetical protein